MEFRLIKNSHYFDRHLHHLRQHLPIQITAAIV